jgi:hypothetical protein
MLQFEDPSSDVPTTAYAFGRATSSSEDKDPYPGINVPHRVSALSQAELRQIVMEIMG